MIPVIDTGTSQANLDFALAYSQGFRACYVKMGGDNVDTYVAPWYASQVDRARAAGFIVGHYWVPDANPADADLIDTPTQQADYMIDRLHDWRPGDFIVLDNEALDGAWLFTDAQAAEFEARVKARLGIPGRQVKTYLGLNDARTRSWPALLATGTQFIIAAYSYPPMELPDIPTIPRARIDGHQYGGRLIGAVVTDTNLFVDDAFNYGPRVVTRKGNAMYLRNQATLQIGHFPEGGTPHVFASLEQYNTYRALCKKHNDRVTAAGSPQFAVLLPPDASNVNNFQNVTAAEWAVAIAVGGVTAVIDTAGVVAGVAAELADDFDTIEVALTELPEAVRANIKEAL